MRKLLTLILLPLALTAGPMAADARNECAALGLSVLQQHLREQQALRAFRRDALEYWAVVTMLAPNDQEIREMGPLGNGHWPIFLNTMDVDRENLTVKDFFPDGVPDAGKLRGLQGITYWISRYHPYQPTEGLLTDGQVLEKLQAERDKARTEWLSLLGKLSELDKAYTERASEAGCPPLHEVYARSRL